MTDTKERILESALRLFARDGYEAVSVSMIAGELALEFYAPMLLLISVSDLTGESQRDALRRHVESFVRRCSPTEN